MKKIEIEKQKIKRTGLMRDIKNGQRRERQAAGTLSNLPLAWQSFYY